MSRLNFRMPRAQPMDVDRYEAVIDACALSLDLAILPQGDRTRVGMRGVNLSGGQRQRVNLARAAYSDTELVLLDNTLSAIDGHTAHHVFKNCVRGLLAARGRSVVLVTHHMALLPQCDAVAIMDGGRCMYFGPWKRQAEVGGWGAPGAGAGGRC